MVLRWLRLLAALSALAAALAADSYRLPQESVPEAYELTIVPYLDEGDRRFTFDGEVTIDVRTTQATSTITLHADDLTIHEIHVVQNNLPEKNLFLSFNTDSTRHFVTLQLAKVVQAGEKLKISIKYRGNVRQQLDGFYRSSYKTADGETRWLGTTQFEPTSARRAFPSFDEPALKATFDIYIAPPVGLTAISNMPLESISGPDPSVDNRVWFKFRSSVPMSTYLVAFVISDFCFLEKDIHRIYGKCDSIKTAEYPLSVSGPILEVLENFTGHPYQLPKMDQAAIPDFSAGAMENWGLVTYREQYLLLNQDTTSRRRSSATVIAHEFAHQWFGNQVSPQWWTYTWLNEAFASFFEYFAANQVEPEWELLYSMVTSMQSNIMLSDSIKLLTHPITHYVETPSQISGSFGQITYSKGGSLIKMAYHFLTEPTFYKGLNIYLSDRAFRAAEPDDLFAAWQEAADQDGVLTEGPTVKEIMDTWTLQSGYPVVTVKRDYEGGTATITQRNFWLIGSDSGDRWFVPISYTTSSEKDFSNTAPRAWLKPNEPLVLTGIDADDWLIVNIQEAGYYRVNYDAENWNRLLAALETEDQGGIHTLNRAQVQSDLSNLKRAGLLPAGVSRSALSALRNEKSPAVWTVAFTNFDELYDKLANTDNLAAVKSALSPLLERLLSEVGLKEREGEHKALSLLRPSLLHWACTLDLAACTSLASNHLMRHGEGEVPEEVRGALWCAAVRAGGDAAWSAALERYAAALDAPERRDALRALACAPDARRLLEAAVEQGEQGLRAEDVAAGLAAACGAARPAHCESALEFVRTNMHQIADRLGGADEVFWLLKRMAPRLRTQGQLDALRAAVAAAQLTWPRVFTPEPVQRLVDDADAARRSADIDVSSLLLTQH